MFIILIIFLYYVSELELSDILTLMAIKSGIVAINLASRQVTYNTRANFIQDVALKGIEMLKEGNSDLAYQVYLLKIKPLPHFANWFKKQLNILKNGVILLENSFQSCEKFCNLLISIWNLLVNIWNSLPNSPSNLISSIEKWVKLLEYDVYGGKSSEYISIEIEGEEIYCNNIKDRRKLSQKFNRETN